MTYTYPTYTACIRVHKNSGRFTPVAPRTTYEALYSLNGVIVDHACGATPDAAERALWAVIRAHTERRVNESVTG